jgi:hypothetical protein
MLPRKSPTGRAAKEREKTAERRTLNRETAEEEPPRRHDATRPQLGANNQIT